MRDGDYHDIWLGLAFTVPVLMLSHLIFPDGGTGQAVMGLLALCGGIEIRHRIEAREERTHDKRA
jgi:hypothetical protein